MPTKRENPQREQVREILQEALSRPDEMNMDELVDEIMETATRYLKNYAIGFMASRFSGRDDITYTEAKDLAERAIQEADLI